MAWLPTMQWDEQRSRLHSLSSPLPPSLPPALPPAVPYLTGSNVCFIKIRVMWCYRNDPWLVWYDEIIHRLRGFLNSAAIFWSGRFDGGDMRICALCVDCELWLRRVTFQVRCCYRECKCVVRSVYRCGLHPRLKWIYGVLRYDV
jgi:hypothetical protein